MNAEFFKSKKEDKLNKDEYTKFLEAQIIILKQENTRLINKIEKLEGRK